MIFLLLRFAGPLLRLVIKLALALALVGLVAYGVGMVGSAAAQDANCSALEDHSERAYQNCLEANNATTTTAAAQGPTNEKGKSVVFYHGDGVRLLSVKKNDDGEAVVRMSSENGGEEVVITDVSRKTSGEMERHRFELERGRNTLRVPLHNPDRPAVTVDAAGRLYLWVGGPDINWAPDKGNAVGVALSAGLLVLLLAVGLHLWATRRKDEAKNPIE